MGGQVSEGDEEVVEWKVRTMVGRWLGVVGGLLCKVLVDPCASYLLRRVVG